MENKNKEHHAKDIENLLVRNYYMNYFFDPIQYDFRTYRILYYFHRNNEPLFYLAFSYTSIFKIFLLINYD